LPLAIALAIGAIWLWRRRSSLPLRAYIATLAIAYWVAATPVGAGLLNANLTRGLGRIVTREEAAGADTVVLLGGGIGTVTVAGRTAGVPTSSSLIRSLDAARVFKAIGAHLLVVSGGNVRPDRQAMPESVVLHRFVIEAGVPPDRILDESSSVSTLEQARCVDALLRPRGIRRVVLVTSPPHMKRALAVFRAVGMEPIGSIAPLRSEQGPTPPFFLPNRESLSFSDDALYEYSALAYYWMRGWI
jgi:uncharacterized SAM-binding protein YcdF (DUF218 family)